MVAVFTLPRFIKIVLPVVLLIVRPPLTAVKPSGVVLLLKRTKLTIFTLANPPVDRRRG